MLVALADSLFLSIDPSAARSRVLLFLVISFAPFLFIAPLIGPVIDRAAGGRRTVIQLVAAARVVLAVLMAVSIDKLTLFPLVFAALVLQKTYLVSKQALVPSVVRTEAELVEANSKLGVIAGLTGFVAVIPAALLQLTPLKGWGTLLYSGAAVRRRPRRAPPGCPPTSSPPRPEQPAERVQLHSSALQLAAVAMLMLRAARRVHVLPPGVLAARRSRRARPGSRVAVGLSALGDDGRQRHRPAPARAPCARRRCSPARSALSAVAGIARRLRSAASPPASVLAVAVNFAAAVGRLAFESIVQRDAPQANRGRAFAQFETRFQLAWAVAGLIPVHHRDPRPGRLPRRRPGRAPSPSPTTSPAPARRSLPARRPRPRRRAADAGSRRCRRRRPRPRDAPSVVSSSRRASHSPGASTSLGVGMASARSSSGRQPVGRRRGRRRPARTPCPGRPGPRRGGCRAAARRTSRWPCVSTRRRRTASAMRRALPPTTRTATASTIQSV